MAQPIIMNVFQPKESWRVFGWARTVMFSVSLKANVRNVKCVHEW